MAQKLAKCGLGVGISSGNTVTITLSFLSLFCNINAPIKLAPDDNKKYLSTDLMREVKIKEHFLSKDITLKGIKNVLR